MKKTSQKMNLPFSMGILIGIMMLGFIKELLFIALPISMNSAAPDWLRIFTWGELLIILVCLIGFFKMRKWAFYLYLAFTLVVQCVLIQINKWNLFYLIWPAIVIIIGVKNWSNMK